MWPNVISGPLTAHIEMSNIRIVNGPPFRPAKSNGLFGTIRAQSHFWPIKGPCFYGCEIFTSVNGLLLPRAQIMFRPVKGPLWTQAYQQNMKSYVDLGPFIGHWNFRPINDREGIGSYSAVFDIRPVRGPLQIWATFSLL